MNHPQNLIDCLKQHPSMLVLSILYWLKQKSISFKIEVQFTWSVVIFQEKHKHVNSLKKFLRKFFDCQWRGTVPLSLGKVERVNNPQPGSLAGWRKLAASMVCIYLFCSSANSDCHHLFTNRTTLSPGNCLFLFFLLAHENIPHSFILFLRIKLPLASIINQRVGNFKKFRNSNFHIIWLHRATQRA